MFKKGNRMRLNKFTIVLIGQLLLVFVVMGVFRAIADRQIAATIAGLLFVASPCLWLSLLWREVSLKHWWFYLGFLQFWLLFALPIFLLRVLNWGTEFENLSILGFSGPFLHQWSSKSYMFMVLTTFLMSRVQRKKHKKPTK